MSRHEAEQLEIPLCEEGGRNPDPRLKGINFVKLCELIDKHKEKLILKHKRRLMRGLSRAFTTAKEKQ